ncbi:hypothetical protein [Kitasatospora sp. NPDC058046]|uniref:hypothetical protein n=1 Tax=Kitasatospora sp. NPDC058046 TaxID=3346312 RepID=UPI0036D84430
MPAHSPTSPAQWTAYNLPSGRAISAAADEAIKASRAAADRLGRVMVVVTAAAVRDVLTGCDHAAGFDAAHAELAANPDGALRATGRYWTAAGEERTFADAVGAEEAGVGLFDMSEWTAYLDDSTADAWRPLVADLPDRDGRPAYRLDLARAATLPLD